MFYFAKNFRRLWPQEGWLFRRPLAVLYRVLFVGLLGTGLLFSNSKALAGEGGDSEAPKELANEMTTGTGAETGNPAGDAVKICRDVLSSESPSISLAVHLTYWSAVEEFRKAREKGVREMSFSLRRAEEDPSSTKDLEQRFAQLVSPRSLLLELGLITLGDPELDLMEEMKLQDMSETMDEKKLLALIAEAEELTKKLEGAYKLGYKAHQWPEVRDSEGKLLNNFERWAVHLQEIREEIERKYIEVRIQFDLHKDVLEIQELRYNYVVRLAGVSLGIRQVFSEYQSRLGNSEALELLIERELLPQLNRRWAQLSPVISARQDAYEAASHQIHAQLVYVDMITELLKVFEIHVPYASE